jgi:DNA-binding CsgD family transcriptional regulator
VRNPSRFTLIDVQPLQPAAARAMGIDVFGGELDPDTLDKLDRAAGIPFFIEAAIHGAHASTPDEAISHRVSQLPVATSEVMSLAAVIGGGFDLTTIAVLADRSVRDIVRAVEPAIERGLVRSTGGGGYEFVHDLIRAAVLEDLPPPLRTPLHREIAEALATAGAESSVVAHHLVNGARPGDEDVAERIRSLCDDVVRRDAALAAELLDRASRLCRTGSPTWAATTADRVVALQWAGRAADALDLANESVTIPMPPAESARMRISRATSLGLVNDLVASADEYRRILDEGGLDDVTRAQVTAELATLDAWGVDRGRARESIDAAVATARTAGATQAELQSLCARSTIELFDGQVGAAVASARAAVERGRGFAGLAPARELYLGLALAGADEHEESDFWFRSGHAAAEAISDLWLVSRYQLAWMAVRLNTGDWEPAMVDAEAVITLHQDTGMGTGMPQAPAIAGIIAIRRGAPPGVIARYRALSAQNAAEGAEPSGLLYAGWFEGLVAEHEGRTDDALATLETLDAMVADSAPLVRMWVAPDLIRVLLDSGESERAVQLVRSLSPFAERMGVASALGTVRLCAGLVAVASGDGHAWALLTDAADLLLGARWKPLAAVALDALSQLNPTRRDDRQRILRSELGIASNDPRGHGRSESASRSDPRSTLTPVERTVAELVADGLANARIAVRLGISKRTVEYHVSNLYMKLGVTNRVAVASLIRSR